MADDIIKDAMERFRQSQDGSDFNREDAENDIKFARLSEQWPDEIKKQRRLEGRPALTINRLPAFIKQVVNDARQNKPGINISPVEASDADTAEVIEGLIRSIERHSNADYAYDTAIDHAVTSGFGFIRLTTDYVHDDSFDLEARIERVPNPLQVHWDVTSTSADASDWDYAFVSDMLTEDEFEAKYPKAEKVNFEAGNRDSFDYWLEDDTVRVAEYWLRERTSRKLLLVRNNFDGSVMPIREADLERVREYLSQQPDGMGGMIDPDIVLEVIREREVDAYTVKRRVITASEVLEEEDWPGSMIPIAPVWGDEVISDGRRYFRSMIRDAKDPQMMFNFWRSATTELVALAPKNPWLIGEETLPSDEQERAKWGQAHVRSFPYLMFNEKSGVMPQRQQFASVPTGAMQEAMVAADDMKAIIGIYDSAMGQRSNETSGRAILARQRESDTANFHFIDNLNRAIRYIGECLVEIIPSVYGARQTIRILGQDQTDKVVRLAQNSAIMGAKSETIDNDQTIFNLDQGRFDVTVSAGPSYSTQREEAREAMIEVMRQVPAAAPVLGDKLMELLDFQGAKEIAERLKMLLPPNIQQAEGVAPQMPQQMPGMPGQPQAGMPAQPMPGQQMPPGPIGV